MRFMRATRHMMFDLHHLDWVVRVRKSVAPQAAQEGRLASRIIEKSHMRLRIRIVTLYTSTHRSNDQELRSRGVETLLRDRLKSGYSTSSCGKIATTARRAGPRQEASRY